MADLTRWDIVVVGGANTDYLVRGKQLPRPGETIQGGEFQAAIGGKGVNQAVAAARMGALVAFVGRVGNDARGDQIIEGLDKEGVDLLTSSTLANAASALATTKLGAQASLPTYHEVLSLLKSRRAA